MSPFHIIKQAYMQKEPNLYNWNVKHCQYLFLTSKNLKTDFRRFDNKNTLNIQTFPFSN